MSKTPRPKAPDGYRVMLGKNLPSPVPSLAKYWFPDDKTWNKSAHSGANSVPAGGGEDWYAIPDTRKKHSVILRSDLQPCVPGGLPNSRPTCKQPLQVQIGGDHYKDFAIQPVEFITKNKLLFLEGCVLKRLCRHKAKNGAEDIRKAIHELQLILELEYNEKP